jgi:hypothetical protein
VNCFVATTPRNDGRKIVDSSRVKVLRFNAVRRAPSICHVPTGGRTRRMAAHVPQVQDTCSQSRHDKGLRPVGRRC